MATYSGKSKRIKNALKGLLGSITYDVGSGAESAFTQVLDSASGEFDGYPAVRLLPSDTTSDRRAKAQSDKTVNLLARVHVELEDDPTTEAAKYDYMYDLTDLIIDTLEGGDEHSALNAYDSTIGTLLMTAARGDWSVAETASGVVLMCDVNISVMYSQDY